MGRDWVPTGLLAGGLTNSIEVSDFPLNGWGGCRAGAPRRRVCLLWVSAGTTTELETCLATKRKRTNIF